MKNYNQNKFQLSFSLDSNISIKSSNYIKENNISDKEILLLDKKNKSENLSNKISKYIPSNNKNQTQYKNSNNLNLIKDIDPESLTFANDNKDENEELSELDDIDSNINYEEFNNNILLAQVLDDEKHKNMFNKNKNLKKVFEGSILITNKNNNDIDHKRKEIYIGQMKTNLSYKWE